MAPQCTVLPSRWSRSALPVLVLSSVLSSAPRYEYWLAVLCAVFEARRARLRSSRRRWHPPSTRAMKNRHPRQPPGHLWWLVVAGRSSSTKRPTALKASVMQSHSKRHEKKWQNVKRKAVNLRKVSLGRQLGWYDCAPPFRRHAEASVYSFSSAASRRFRSSSRAATSLLGKGHEELYQPWSSQGDRAHLLWT